MTKVAVAELNIAESGSQADPITPSRASLSGLGQLGLVAESNIIDTYGKSQEPLRPLEPEADNNEEGMSWAWRIR